LVAQGPCAHGEFFFLRRLTIGRSRENNVCLTHPTVSERHAVIEGSPAEFKIKDLGSKNGVLVNGQKVSEAVLNHCDRIQLGKTLLVFLKSGAAATSAVGSSQEPLGGVVDGTVTVELVDCSETASVGTGQAASRIAAATKRALVYLDSWLGADDVRSLSARILADVVKLVGADRGAMLLVEQGALTMVAAHLSQGVNGVVTVPRTVASRVLATRGGIVSGSPMTDAALADQPSILRQGLSSLVAVPVMIDANAEGVLYLDSLTRQELFDRRTVSDLMAVGRAAAVALHEVQRRLRSEGQASATTALGRHFPSTVVEAMRQRGSALQRPIRTTAAVLRVGVNTLGRADPSEEEYLTLLDEFTRRAQWVVLRTGGAVEMVVGPTIKALYGYPDARSLDDLRPLQAALEIQRELHGLSLGTVLASGIGLSARVSLEVGDLIASLLGDENRTQLFSIGEVAQAASTLLSLSSKGEVLLGPAAVERWGSELVLGRTVTVKGQSPGLPEGGQARSLVGLRREPGPRNLERRLAVDAIPVRIQSLTTLTTTDGLFMPDHADPHHGVLEWTRPAGVPRVSPDERLRIAFLVWDGTTSEAFTATIKAVTPVADVEAGVLLSLDIELETPVNAEETTA
ncbi:MAG: FHA domain-containing protein, partial [Candidatus Riflebacteria bacterium]|nr:FHA domain-containing protein [Candidatus Riflebacteria bacterium]